SQSEFKPAAFFSSKLSISTKTVYYDIEKLNEQLITVPNTDIRIEKSPRKGLMLVGEKTDIEPIISYLEQKNSHSYFNQKSRRLSPEYRRLDIVKRCLLKSESVSLEQLSDDYLVSKTSLHKDIEFINRALEQENILLNVTHKGIYIDGNENQIQRAIKHFLSLYIHKQDDYYLNQLMKSFIGDDSF
ncbi:Mga helix-turn-helix domain protein, partial [Gilliamella apis SCGC AB-598-P17]